MSDEFTTLDFVAELARNVQENAEESKNPQHLPHIGHLESMTSIKVDEDATPKQPLLKNVSSSYV